MRIYEHYYDNKHKHQDVFPIPNYYLMLETWRHNIIHNIHMGHGRYIRMLLWKDVRNI